MEPRNQTRHPRATKKPGMHLFCECLVFCLVYAVCIVGNLLIAAVLSELCMPLFGSLSELAVSNDPSAAVEAVLSVPYLPLISLFATAATIMIVLLFCRVIQKRSWTSVGLSRRHAFSGYVWGIFLGAAAISVPVIICIIFGMGHMGPWDPADASVIALFFGAYLIQGASEEVLCRGYFMNSIARRYPMWLAVVISSVFFALLHMPNNGLSLIALLNLFLFGVFAALLTIRTGSIWCASGFHSAWNFFQGNFFGIKVSGMDMHGSLFRFIPGSSTVILNGGDFGIEGGLLCTVFFLACILILIAWGRRDAGASRVQTCEKDN